MGRKSKAEERKEQILEHYYQVICDEGFENASIAKIAAHMDTQPSLIMHYFKTKEKLIFELLSKFLHEYVSGKLEEYYSETDLRKRLENIINVSSRKDKMPTDISKMLYVVKYLAESYPEIKIELKNTINKYRTIVVKIFEEMYDNDIILNRDAEELADLLMILSSGYEESIQTFITDENNLYYQDFIHQLLIDKLQINYELSTI